MSHDEHHEKARGPVACAVVTVSDTRTEETDTSGRLIIDQLQAAGHSVILYRIVPDDPAAVNAVLYTMPIEAKAVLLNGGTGISPRDQTVEAAEALFEKRLPGFGELFRSLSYSQIGAAAMMSRATAGVMGGRVVYLMPGSTGAVSLAMEKLILPELSHAVWEVSR